jgi:hypothetical protein
MKHEGVRSPVLVGANPGVRLYDGEALTAYVSAWRVDWSIHGGGTAVVMWRAGEVHVYGENPELGAWLEREFVRHFPEAEGLSWPEPLVRHLPIDLRLDLDTGLDIRVEGLEVRAWGVLDRRTYATEDFKLGDVGHSLSLVLAPCRHATVIHEGQPVPGEPQVDGTTSSAFLAEAEVWCR